MTNTTQSTPEDRARKRAKDLTDVQWHVAAYLIINAFLWTIDIATGGTYWAFWVTAGWGIGVLFHVASYLIDDNGRESRHYERFLAEEKAREDQQGS